MAAFMRGTLLPSIAAWAILVKFLPIILNQKKTSGYASMWVLQRVKNNWVIDGNNRVLSETRILPNSPSKHENHASNMGLYGPFSHFQSLWGETHTWIAMMKVNVKIFMIWLYV